MILLHLVAFRLHLAVFRLHVAGFRLLVGWYNVFSLSVFLAAGFFLISVFTFSLNVIVLSSLGGEKDFIASGSLVVLWAGSLAWWNAAFTPRRSPVQVRPGPPEQIPSTRVLTMKRKLMPK